MKIAFIENDPVLNPMIMRILEIRTKCLFQDYFTDIVLNARNNPEQVFEAIRKCHIIIFSSELTGDSGMLLNNMIQMAVKYNIRNKLVINIYPNWSESNLQIDTIKGLTRLEAFNNIVFSNMKNIQYLWTPISTNSKITWDGRIIQS